MPRLLNLVRPRSVAGSLLWLPSSVEDELKQEADRTYPLETGGVLVGFVDANDERQIQVVSATGPGPRAIHRAHRFEPDAEWQQARIAELYRRSDNVVSYLGDWHSHPKGTGTPSRLDRRTAARIAAAREARAAHPVMLILAGSPYPWRPSAHRYGRWRLREIDCRRDAPEAKVTA